MLCALLCALLCAWAAAARASGGEDRSSAAQGADAAQAASATDTTGDSAVAHRPRGELSAQGRAARGIYLNARTMRRTSVRSLVSRLERMQFDAVVIDVKDSSGNLSVDTRVPEYRQAVNRRLRIRQLREKLAELKHAGIYTIARVACFADDRLARRMPELAVRHQHSQRPWVSGGTGGAWLDPHNPRNHQLLLALALEVQALGFDELQLDYVRFPVDGATEWATFPAEGEGTRVDALVSLLRTLDAGLDIPIGVDVFGLTAYREGDPSGLGQDLERWAEHVEVISPMLYVNAMRDWQVGQRNRTQYLVQNGVSALRRRVGDGVVIRPYLQAFSTGADEFNPRFFAAQIRGAERGGGDGFLFWHTASRYQMLESAARRLRGMYPFARAMRDHSRSSTSQ
ncbi:MAG: putative glycoside hydrolase [Polyangiales bacterium]|nr:hypothetical protein [Sandaracinaceae bacterium]